MINKDEITAFVIASLIIGLGSAFKSISFSELSSFLPMLQYSLFAFIAIIIGAAACKLAAYKYGCDADFRLWNIYIHKIRKRAAKIPAWLILPFALAVLTFGYIKWLALLVFDAVQKERIGRDYSELHEFELGLIAATGPVANLIVAVISQAFGWADFALLNAGLACFSLLPLHELNGSKVFFGSRMLWVFVFALSLAVFILLGIENVITTIIASGVLAVFAVILLYLFHEAK